MVDFLIFKKNFIKKNLKFLLLHSLLFYSFKIKARFIEKDAEEIDKDYQLHEEMFHNRLSYLNSLAWKKNWWEKETGYWTHLGSLNLFYLHHDEQIKLSSPNNKKIILKFKRSQAGEISFNQSQNELSLNFNVFSKLYIGIMSDIISDKRYYDGGGKIFYMLSPKHLVEFNFWLTENFYNEKEYQPEDKIDKASKTYSLSYKKITNNLYSIS